MIRAVFYKCKNSFNGFDISGHSGYAKRGKDIVCASVSVLSLHTARILNEECKAVEALEQDENGRLSIKLKSTDEITEMLIKRLIQTLREIQEEYSGYLL
ncbi:MAG: ribosomal-processing cysteine protease Prp, partial [Thermotogota bacterium]